MQEVEEPSLPGRPDADPFEIYLAQLDVIDDIVAKFKVDKLHEIAMRRLAVEHDVDAPDAKRRKQQEPECEPES